VRASSAPDGRRLAEPVRRGSSKQTRRCPVAGCLGFPFRRDGTGRMVPEAADPNQPPTTAKTDRCLAASAPPRQPRRRHDEPPRLPVGARTPRSINGAGSRRGDPPPLAALNSRDQPMLPPPLPLAADGQGGESGDERERRPWGGVSTPQAHSPRVVPKIMPGSTLLYLVPMCPCRSHGHGDFCPSSAQGLQFSWISTFIRMFWLGVVKNFNFLSR